MSSSIRWCIIWLSIREVLKVIKIYKLIVIKDEIEGNEMIIRMFDEIFSDKRISITKS